MFSGKCFVPLLYQCKITENFMGVSVLVIFLFICHSRVMYSFTVFCAFPKGNISCIDTGKV
jgi:hypothetical protein